MNYKDLDDREIEAIIKCYDGTIKRFNRMNYLGMFEVYYKDTPPIIKDISYLDPFILDLKLKYRDMRLDLMLK